MGFWFRVYGEMVDIFVREICFKLVMIFVGYEFEYLLSY